MNDQQRKDLVRDIGDLCLQMKSVARQLMVHPGRCAAKGVEMRNAADIALEWADAIKRGEE